MSFNPNKFRPDPKPPKKEKVKKGVNKVSKKQKKNNLCYLKQRKEFLSKPENEFCFIEGCNRRANTIEHTRGRKGYADQWARDNGILLLNDERFFKSCCLQHNLELETSPELSKKYQLSKIHGGKK